MIADPARVFVKFDAGSADQALISRFHDLPYRHKVSFSDAAYPDLPGHFRKRRLHRHLDGLQFYRTADQYFDLIHWINTGEVKPAV